MNKSKKILIATLGGVDTVMYIMTPILLAFLWANVVGLNDWRSLLLYFIAGISTLFRGINIGVLR